MKKIDLHIHTVKTDSDADFIFSLDTLGEYIKQRKLDCVAITNHNTFVESNFKEISDKYGASATILPGIEVDLEGGHILVISSIDFLPDFIKKCQLVNLKWNASKTPLTFSEFCLIFDDLNRYLFIPHYKKDKALREELIKLFGKHIFSGEVTNLKQFEVCKKNPSMLVPVVFSDCRISADLTKNLPISQTYIDADIITSIAQIKLCLGDKSKVFLDPSKAPGSFGVLEDGTTASTGLTVIMGERSSGKTYTLNQIKSNFPNMKIKYIKQFELIELGTEEENKEKFKKLLSGIQALESEEYLDKFKSTINSIVDINVDTNEKDLEKYLGSVRKVAFETEKIDVFSKTKLYNEVDLVLEMHNDLDKLITSLQDIISPSKYTSIIEKYLPKEQLDNLLKELLEQFRLISLENKMKTITNEIILSTRTDLQFKSSAPMIERIDIKKLIIESQSITWFSKIANSICQEKRIRDDDLYGFKIVTSTKKFANADDVKGVLHISASLKDAFKLYEEPYAYLCALKEKISPDMLYKCFVKVEYIVKNQYGFDVSGGERAEFNLVRLLNDAYTCDMVLIDEPESSFDNLFLASKIKNLIKDLAEKMPVIVSTHNNTIGASFFPNRVLYTRRFIAPGKSPDFQIYSGGFLDTVLKDNKGNELENYSVYMNSLEGGENQYDERKGKIYAAVKNSR